MIAEEVDKVFPDIVTRNVDGQIDSVQYHVLPVLLLNEMKKQQISIEELKQGNSDRDNIIQDLLERMRSLESRV